MNELLTSLFLILFCGFLNAQELQPLKLVEKVFTDKKFVQKTSKFSTGEYKGHPNVNDLGENTNLKFRLLNQSENSAVVNITIVDNLGNGIDTYAHLKKDKKWKIGAFRALAMTGILYQIKTEFEKMTEQQIDSLIKTDTENFKSRKDFDIEFENIKLTLDLDDTIIEHFKKNERKFEQLRTELLNIEINEDEQTYRKIDLGEKINFDYKELLLSSISTSNYCDNCFEFVIGGMIDNTVGYLFIPNGQSIPKMSPNRLILLREIGNGWYIFKTT